MSLLDEVAYSLSGPLRAETTSGLFLPGQIDGMRPNTISGSECASIGGSSGYFQAQVGA